MSAKNLSPRLFCIFGLIVVVVIAALLYVTTDSYEKTLIGTCIALVALICYIIFKIGDGWMNSVEAEQIKSDQTRFTARIDRYRLSLSALPEGVVLFRQGHTVEWCNPAPLKSSLMNQAEFYCSRRSLPIKLTSLLSRTTSPNSAA